MLAYVPDFQISGVFSLPLHRLTNKFFLNKSCRFKWLLIFYFSIVFLVSNFNIPTAAGGLVVNTLVILA